MCVLQVCAAATTGPPGVLSVGDFLALPCKESHTNLPDCQPEDSLIH